MPTYSPVQSRPLALAPSTEANVYALFAVAMGLTVVGVYVGVQFALQILTSGMHLMFLIAELAIIFTARLWMERSPWNVILFALFPLLSGITITPYILYVLLEYANGAAILFNALGATACMALAAALVPRVTGWQMGAAAGRALLMSVIGLLVLAVFQIFVPSMRTGQMEVLISGIGIVVFALFTAYDLQRISALGRLGGNAFLLALSLYLDIFNLFLYVLRFMVAVSGRRH